MPTIEVVLVTGPAGSGKSTVAARLAERIDGGVALSEDAYWARRGWSGLRTEEQEALVQAAVLDDLTDALRGGRRVVLEFILYKPPPNPLTAYRAALDAAGIAHATLALAPSAETIMERLRRRGRPTDLADLEGRRADAVRQLACVQEPWVVADLLLVDDLSTAAEIAETWIAAAP